MLFDLAVQQYGLQKAATDIKDRVEMEHPSSQRDLLQIAVEERSKKARQEYVADAMSRRMGILQQGTFSHTAFGFTSARSNKNFHIIKKDATTHVCSI
jgi:hypothetical protein